VAEEPDDERGATPRPFWAGTITFGLVSVPVSLFPATRGSRASLRMVGPDGTPLSRRYVCSKDGEPLEWDEIVRGYEVESGKFVVVSDDELEAIEPRKTREIDLRLFVARDEIDPMYFERAYFLVPSGGSNKAYRLLAEVMEKSGRAGIATFVMRAKEYLVAILSDNGILHAETLRFHDEIRTPADVGLPSIARPKPADVKKFESAIAKAAGKVDFSEFLDDSREGLESLVEQKRKRGEDVVDTPGADAGEEGGEIVDLLDVLSRSLGGTAGGKRPAKKAPPRKSKAPAGKKSAKKTPAKKTAAKKSPAKKTTARKRSAKKPARKGA
jgi:DNA end-binding protein Ku